MKNLVTGLMLITLILSLGCGDRQPCAEEGCEEPRRISDSFYRDCAERHYIETELAKAKSRRRYMQIWEVADKNLKRVRRMADAISPPTPEVISARKRWEKEEQRRRNKILRYKGLLPR